MKLTYHKRFTGLCILIIFLVSARARAQMPCEYDVTIIQAPVDCGIFGTVNTFGLGINENGAVVGYYQCPLWEHSEAFVWTAEDGFVTLERPEGVYSAGAVDINDNGVICGTAWMFDLGKRGFVYEDGKMTILDPVIPDAGWSSASAINNAGIVVGQRSITKNLNPKNAYFWSVEEGFTDLGVMNGPNSSATDINENGDICGWMGNTFFAPDARAFYTTQEVIVLEPVPGGFQSAAFALNNQSNLVGTGWVTLKGFPIGAPCAFLWDAGKYTMLGALPDHMLSRSDDINDKGVIVGGSSYVDGNSNIHHAIIFYDQVLFNLNDFIDPELQLLLKSASAISNSRRIVAVGNDGEGEILSLLLTPLPEPLGDLSGDCQVRTADLLLLLNAWATQDLSADLNDDGIVNHLDLFLLFDNWG
ncbi:MAG: DUF3466 family protein [Planctomycetes bacterium]|nr:DUF3466 family protein [Planctomycetota bacterium]